MNLILSVNIWLLKIEIYLSNLMQQRLPFGYPFAFYQTLCCSQMPRVHFNNLQCTFFDSSKQKISLRIKKPFFLPTFSCPNLAAFKWRPLVKLSDLIKNVLGKFCNFYENLSGSCGQK